MEDAGSARNPNLTTNPEPEPKPRGGKKLVMALLFCVICVAVNCIGSQIAHLSGLPLYLDSLGVILASVFGGYIPGIVVGYATNIATTAADPTSFYYSLVNVLIAVVAAAFGHRGWLEKPLGILAAIVAFAVIGGGFGAAITWGLFGAAEGTTFASQLAADFPRDLADKAIVVLIAAAIVRLVPQDLKNLFDFSIWQQAPLEGEQLAAAKRTDTRRFSLRTKIVAILAAAMVIVAVVTTSISYEMYHASNIATQGEKGMGIANLVAEKVDADRVPEYLRLGDDAPGYAAVERELAEIRDSFSDVQYIYVYQIREDGCHVVIDPDTADEPGSDPGDVIEFDDAFLPYRDDLLAGRSIEPVVSNETYGWLLTAYRPLYDSSGACACYVAVDISMDKLVAEEFGYVARIVILFAAFFVLVCAIVIWLAEYGLIMPVNSIARASAAFAFGDDSNHGESVRQLQRLDIRTGDEVENLYRAVTKTSEDAVQFIADSREKAATIERMQDNLIMVMADLVESRDKYTGDHVRKTAAYTKVIMDQMRREGIYADVLTDEYVSNVVKSAPLHDVGKIAVSDAILNKPGRLTDEEFAIMRSHTVAGERILEDAKGAVSEAGYLDEARRLAAYHHEKWSGQGYPYGLAGQDIPLSARIMAVADVFDALVSKRSYKDGMPIDKALSIIEKDAGTHFDPLVARAFLDAEPEVRRIAEAHGDASGTASDIRS